MEGIRTTRDLFLDMLGEARFRSGLYTTATSRMRPPTCRTWGRRDEHPYRRVEGLLSYSITQDALDAAAAAAANLVDGVEVARGRFARPRGRGAHVEVDGDRVRARIEIACRYGAILPRRASARRAAPRDGTLRTLTGLEVDGVDVEVVAVTR